jgi:ketosteroid isomerase-like protein
VGTGEKTGRVAVIGGTDGGPTQTVNAFTKALVGGDARGAASFFSPLSRFLTPDGTDVTGRTSITELLAQLIAPGHRLEIRTGRILRADSVALCTQYWKRTSRGTQVERFESASTARLVLHRTEARWEIAIASPWG